MTTGFDKAVLALLMRNLPVESYEQGVSKEKYSSKVEFFVNDFYFHKMGACTISAFTIVAIDELVMDGINRDVRRDATLFRKMKAEFIRRNPTRKRAKEDTVGMFKLNQIIENILEENGLSPDDINPEAWAKAIVRTKNKS